MSIRQVTITVSGDVGTGKSAICGEIEIMCRALRIPVVWENGDEEKNLTHADWTEALGMYKPTVTIVEAVARTECQHEWVRTYVGERVTGSQCIHCKATKDLSAEQEMKADLYDSMLHRARALGFSSIASALDAAATVQPQTLEQPQTVRRIACVCLGRLVGCTNCLGRGYIEVSPTPEAVEEITRPYGNVAITGPVEDVRFVLSNLADVDDDEPQPEVGWQLVPTRHKGKAGLTDAMMRAFYKAVESKGTRGDFESLNAGYNAMLAAAPVPNPDRALSLPPEMPDVLATSKEYVAGAFSRRNYEAMRDAVIDAEGSSIEEPIKSSDIWAVQAALRSTGHVTNDQASELAILAINTLLSRWYRMKEQNDEQPPRGQ